MMMQQTSLLAYEELNKGGLSVRQTSVLRAIKRCGVVSDKSLANVLNWPINCVTPRRGELVKAGVVVEVGVALENGRKVLVWGLSR